MTVEIRVDQLFTGTDLARFVEIYFSEPFNEAVAAHIGLRERTLVESQRLPDGQLRRRVRMVPPVRLPPLLVGRLGRGGLFYDEVSVYDPARAVLRYRVESALQERVAVKGVISFVPHPEGVRRIIEGQVRVSLPGLSGRVERLVEREVNRGYERIAAFLQAWIDSSAR